MSNIGPSLPFGAQTTTTVTTTLHHEHHDHDNLVTAPKHYKSYYKSYYYGANNKFHIMNYITLTFDLGAVSKRQPCFKDSTIPRGEKRAACLPIGSLVVPFLNFGITL